MKLGDRVRFKDSETHGFIIDIERIENLTVATVYDLATGVEYYAFPEDLWWLYSDLVSWYHHDVLLLDKTVTPCYEAVTYGRTTGVEEP